MTAAVEKAIDERAPARARQALDAADDGTERCLREKVLERAQLRVAPHERHEDAGGPAHAHA